MNKYETEKKTKSDLQKEIDQKDAELKQLREELEAAKGPMSMHIPPPSSQRQVDEVEAELEQLRQSFADAADDDNTTQILTWDDVPRLSGPGSEGGDTIMIHEDEDDDEEQFPSSHHQPSRMAMNSDALTMGLELQAAREAKSNLLGSFRDQAVNTSFGFQFADTPARQNQEHSTTETFRIPETPPTFYHDLSKQLKEATNRAEEVEVALTALDIEITNLGFGNADKDDTMTMVTAIAEHFRTARLELERLVPGETSVGFENASVLPEILRKTKVLAEKLKSRENELKASKDQHRNLKNNFEKAIIAAENANERVKKLESVIDNHAEETLHIRMRSQELEREVAEKEKDVTCLSNALNKYRADIARLEDLITTMQQDYEHSQNAAASSSEKIEELEARVTSETTGRRAAELSAVQRLAKINDLETSLATSRRHASDLESRLSSVQQDHSSSSFSASTSFAHAQEITDLNQRISTLANSLAIANAEVEKLRITKQKLEERVRSEVETGARAVETLQEQLIRTVMKGNEARKRYVNGAKIRIANWELDDDRELSSDGTEEARTPSSVHFAEWAEVETIERVDGGQETELPEVDEQSGSESVPGSVEVNRGRGRYRKTPKLVSFDKARRSGAGLGIDAETPAPKRGKRKYDSGIGMDSDFEIYDEAQDQGYGKGAGEMRNGMMTPELSSDGDVEVDFGAEAEMVM